MKDAFVPKLTHGRGCREEQLVLWSLDCDGGSGAGHEYWDIWNCGDKEENVVEKKRLLFSFLLFYYFKSNILTDQRITGRYEIVENPNHSRSNPKVSELD